MRTPTGQFEIDLHVARARQFIVELNDRTAKIRSALAIKKTGMKNSHASAVQCHKLLAEHALVLPDCLQ